MLIGANAYEDLRPLIQSPVKLAGGILAVVENLLGLPIEYVNIRLGQFREKLRIRLEAIPKEERQLPPLLVTSQVLREVTFCVDEDALQDMFANLLASASNKKTANNVHPSFASVIVQLTREDALLLSQLPTVVPLQLVTRDATTVSIEKQAFDATNLLR